LSFSLGCCLDLMDADDVDDASQLYLRLHALGLSEDAAWATVLNGKALGLTDEDIFEDVSNPEGNGVRNHRDREVEEARDSTQGPARKMVQLPMRGSPLPESKLLLFREVHTRMYRSGDPVLRELGMQLKTMLDFYSASLTVIGCAARKFAEGLAGWMLVEHFPVEYPSIDVLRGRGGGRFVPTWESQRFQPVQELHPQCVRWWVRHPTETTGRRNRHFARLSQRLAWQFAAQHQISFDRISKSSVSVLQSLFGG